MAKLHELLAVESNLRTQADSCRVDLMNTFEKKTNHFKEVVVSFQPIEEGNPPTIESQLKLQTTVTRELDWIGEKIAKAINISHAIDIANTLAKADVVLDNGRVLLENVPATSLLQLEKRVREVHSLVQGIPTLDPSKNFQVDDSMGHGIYRARDDSRPRTKKSFSYIVMVPPTDRHPAQVKELMEDAVVGHTTSQEWSSLITVGEKASMLDRVEEILRAVKKARARANEVEVDVKEAQIGWSILGYIFAG